MRGRKPKTAAQQIAAGDPRKHGARKLEEMREREAKATRGLPACPRHLRGRARAAWGFWAAELRDMEQDHRPDAMMLEGACANYARAVQADLEVARVGITVEESYVDEETGEVTVLKVRMNPAVTVSNQAWRQVRSFCSEFGMSPVSRTRLSIEKQDMGAEDLAAILSQPRKPRADSPTVN
jgi:P27 family predicted phage terminase small subunit